MKTKLLEFGNENSIRGILTLPDHEINGGIICLHGFGRVATTETKFKKLADSLVDNMIANFRFDFSGSGLSDWDFRNTTIENQWEELLLAIETLKKEIWNLKISVVAHSLWACVLATKLDGLKDQIEKILLISPALNQKDLLRYRFVRDQMKKQNPELKITWDNYKEYLKEEDFLKDCEKIGKMTKTSYIDSAYFMQAKDCDFSKKFENIDKEILLIHGKNDDKVPLESLNINIKNQILVESGDHDMERPDQLSQWVEKWVNFLLK